MKQYQIASTYTLSHIIDEENNSICGTRFNAVAPIKKLKKRFQSYNEWQQTSEYNTTLPVERQNVSCLKCIAKSKKLWVGCKSRRAIKINSKGGNLYGNILV